MRLLVAATATHGSGVTTREHSHEPGLCLALALQSTFFEHRETIEAEDWRDPGGAMGLISAHRGRHLGTTAARPRGCTSYIRRQAHA